MNKFDEYRLFGETDELKKLISEKPDSPIAVLNGEIVNNSSTISKRDQKFKILCNELEYWGLINLETDMGAVKSIANELPLGILMRIIHKLQRKRMSNR